VATFVVLSKSYAQFFNKEDIQTDRTLVADKKKPGNAGLK